MTTNKITQIDPQFDSRLTGRFGLHRGAERVPGLFTDDGAAGIARILGSGFIYRVAGVMKNVCSTKPPLGWTLVESCCKDVSDPFRQ